jgi:hypothetical protein
MAGTFAGLSNVEWQLVADVFPPELTKRSRDIPHPPFVRSSVPCSTSCSPAAGVICRMARHGAPSAPHIGGCSAGRPMGRWRPCSRAYSGSPRNAG